MDKDGNGQVDWEEFRRCPRHEAPRLRHDRRRQERRHLPQRMGQLHEIPYGRPEGNASRRNGYASGHGRQSHASSEPKRAVCP
ncbi:MAG: EF-hand domain-containing protein [Bilophila wadsworthia]